MSELKTSSKVELIGVLIAMAVVGVVLVAAQRMPANARQFPIVVGGTLFGLLTIQLGITALKLWGKNEDKGRERVIMDADLGAGLEDRYIFKKTVYFFGWLVLFLVAVYLFGFQLGGVGVLFIFARFGFGESWIGSISLAGVAAAMLFLVAEFLHTPMPPGALL